MEGVILLHPHAATTSGFRSDGYFQQTSPDSPFTQKRICSRLTADGRITVSDRKLIVTAGGIRQERNLDSEEEWAKVLNEHFGITLE